MPLNIVVEFSQPMAKKEGVAWSLKILGESLHM